MAEISMVQNVSAETKATMARKSAQTLPNHPSEMGYSAEEIKKRLYLHVLDTANSAMTEIDRVINETNHALAQLDDNFTTFIDNSIITESYKQVLNSENWSYNQTTKLYEYIITAERHGINNYQEIGVDMFLLDANNKYIPVNCYEILPNGDVRCFHESNGAGHISIYVKREGFIVGQYATDAERIVGLAKVAKTNKYEDLDDIPDLSQISAHETAISRIISGSQSIGRATRADNADNATYAEVSGRTDHATTSDNAQRAVADQNGTNIFQNYCRQFGNYPNVKAGRCVLADMAECDEDGMNFKNTYAKKSGLYYDLIAGSALNAETAITADSATKATKDGNGAPISTTYVKVAGNGQTGYPNVRVGHATRADEAGNSVNAERATEAIKATQDGLGRDISQTYAVGCSIDLESINIEMRVSQIPDASLSETTDFFNNEVRPFSMNVITAKKSGVANKQITGGSICKVMTKTSGVYDPKWLFIKFPDGYLPPKHIILTNEQYNYGFTPNTTTLDDGGPQSYTLKARGYTRYRIFDKGYDFANGNNVSMLFVY